MLLAFIWVLLGRTGASAVSEEKSLFLSIPSPLSIKFGGYYGKSQRNRFLFRLMVGLAICTNGQTRSRLCGNVAS